MTEPGTLRSVSWLSAGVRAAASARSSSEASIEAISW